MIHSIWILSVSYCIQFIFFLSIIIFNTTYMLIFTQSYTVSPFHHIVFCLNIYNTLVTLTNNIPRLYQVVVKYYHIFYNNTVKHCILAINQHKGKWNPLMILLPIFCLLRWVPLQPDLVDFYVFCIHFALQRPNPIPYHLSLTFYFFRLHHQPKHT